MRISDWSSDVCSSDLFTPPNYLLLQEDGGTNMIAAPNCWGGYGFTVNTNKVDAADSESVGLLFNEKSSGHLSTSARFEENIALAGILAAHPTGRSAARSVGEECVSTSRSRVVP